MSELSVIVIDDQSPEVLAICHSHLDRLILRERVSISTVRVGRGDSIMGARAAAGRGSRTNYSLFLNPRYRVNERWAAAILEKHAAGYSVVAGPVDAATTMNGDARAIFLWEYSHATSPVETGTITRDQARLFPGGNTSYAAEVLCRYDLASFANEMEFHAQLFADGVPFCQSADAGVLYAPPAMGQYLRDLFRTSSNQAALRPSSWVEKFFQAIIRALLLAPWLLLKNVLKTWGKSRCRKLLVPALGWFVVFAVVQSAGEVSSYVSGLIWPSRSSGQGRV